MRDGEHEFYIIQHRTVAESQSRLSLSTVKLKKIKPTEWKNASWDFFGKALDPHIGTGNDWRPKNKKKSDEAHAVWAATGQKGWYTRAFADQALTDLCVADDAGAFDHSSAARHEFRIIKMTISQQSEVVAELRTHWTANL